MISCTDTSCTNQVGLTNRLLLRTELPRHINATSFTPPYYPYEARIHRIGWCSEDIVMCNSEETQFIEVDFGAEVIVEAIAILRVGGSCVKKYYVQYAGSDGEFYCATEKLSNSTVRTYVCYVHVEIAITS